MPGFPDTPDYSGLNAPIGQEYDHADLAVEGTIPAAIVGTFFRAVPDPAFPPIVHDAAASLSGDGMISAIRIADGAVSIHMRYVMTDRHRAEVAAGRALFGAYRNPFTDAPEAHGIDRTVSNTTPVWHAGKLLMAKEDGRATRVDPHSLATLGRHDFDGKLKSATMTAHVRIDPDTGEMFFFGYEADGLASTKIAYCIADRDGALVSEQWFDAPYCAMMHDFTITANYALFPVYPTTASIERMQAGGDHWAHEMDRESWLGVAPRYGSVSDIRWFRGPKGVHCFHMMNAFEDDTGIIHFDQCLSNANAFPFIRKAGGIEMAPWEVESWLGRWSIDPNGDADVVTSSVIGPPGDFPVIPADRQGRAYEHAWMLTMNPAMQGPPVLGGPVGAMFNMLLRLDMAGGPPAAFALPPGMCFNEPVHVPSGRDDHEGWLMMIVDRQTGPADFAHALWIFDGGAIANGPIATVAIPERLRPQIHGWWVSADQLAAAA